MRGSRGTTKSGYRNRNGQVVVRATDQAGNDFGQRVYVLRCEAPGHDHGSFEYGANGSDIWQRKCPKCQGGKPGLAYGA